MNSLKFFNHAKIADKPAVEWGTGYLQNEKFDPTLIRSPNYILHNQPIPQYYYESNLELSNVRSNDQIMPSALKENLLEKQIMRKFPMMHPFTSQTSYKRILPNFTAPEDQNKGDVALNTKLTYNDYTPAQVDKTTVQKKISGNPWRHELRYLTLPNHPNGLWYNDKDLYHYPKPSESMQNYYPAPPSLLVANPKLRQTSLQIDANTADILANKERELMQTSNRIDYYKDGLGTRAPLNSDNYNEKQIKLDQTSKIDEEMIPYFRRGAGISQFTATDEQLPYREPVKQRSMKNKSVLTDLEKNEILIEKGKNYENLPQENYQDNSLVPTFNILARSKTLPNFPVNQSTPNIKDKSLHKMNAEKQKLIRDNRERIQRVEYELRKKEIDLIQPAEDIRLLKLKYNELENARGAKPNLKQNIKQHVNTLYEQQRKYMGERAELYKTKVYNPYLVKPHVESVKVQPTVSAFFSNGAAIPGQKNVYIPDEIGQQRPILFADKVLNDYSTIKRTPLENILLNPNASANPTVQENVFTQQQTTYGESYNTKKFLQENECVLNEETFYGRLHNDEIEAQNIVLKSAAEQIALYNYHTGLAEKPQDLEKANKILDQVTVETKNTEYPRLKGPISPEPYEQIYCTNEISEMGEGFSKRFYTRIYVSPNESAHARFEPLCADLEAIESFNQKAKKDQAERESLQKKLEDKYRKNLLQTEFSMNQDQLKAARRDLDIMTKMKQDKDMISTYNDSYTPYRYENQVKCPSNEYYKNIEYTQRPSTSARVNNQEIPVNIKDLQDGWSKSQAIRCFHSAYDTRMKDLRENNYKGKKIVSDSPMNAYRYV